MTAQTKQMPLTSSSLLGKRVKYEVVKYKDGKRFACLRSGIVTKVYHCPKGPNVGKLVADIRLDPEDAFDAQMAVHMCLINKIIGYEKFKLPTVAPRPMRCRICGKMNLWSFVCRSCRNKLAASGGRV